MIRTRQEQEEEEQYSLDYIQQNFNITPFSYIVNPDGSCDMYILIKCIRNSRVDWILYTSPSLVDPNNLYVYAVSECSHTIKTIMDSLITMSHVEDEPCNPCYSRDNLVENNDLQNCSLKLKGVTIRGVTTVLNFKLFPTNSPNTAEPVNIVVDNSQFLEYCISQDSYLTLDILIFFTWNTSSEGLVALERLKTRSLLTNIDATTPQVHNPSKRVRER